MEGSISFLKLSTSGKDQGKELRLVQFALYPADLGSNPVGRVRAVNERFEAPKPLDKTMPSIASLTRVRSDAGFEQLAPRHFTPTTTQ